MRFLLDAQLPHGLADRFREAGHEARHVRSLGLREAADRKIWHFASAEKMVLITKDDDFVRLSLMSPAGPPVVWIRLGNISNRKLWAALEPLLDSIVRSIEQGERLIEILDI